MLNDVTLGDFEERSQLVQLRDRENVECAHCALASNALTCEI